MIECSAWAEVLRVLEQLAEGHSNAVIAANLGYSAHRRP